MMNDIICPPVDRKPHTKTRKREKIIGSFCGSVYNVQIRPYKLRRLPKEVKTMKKKLKVLFALLVVSSLGIVLVLFCGCYSLTTERFEKTRCHNYGADSFRAEAILCGESSDWHIPFVYWKMEESAPFTPTLKVWSEEPVSGTLSVRAAVLDTNDGQSFILQDETAKSLTLSIQKREIINSSSVGLITNYVYEAMHDFRPLPIQFNEGMKCDLRIEIAAEPSGKSFFLRQEFKGKKSHERGAILKAYANI